MQCSGIHRSLGVHISKVRSATLDTWLPDQVAFIQSMGNVKSNSYWEAELPRNYDRVGIENFIRAKYEEKRWAAKDRIPNSPSRFQENKAPTPLSPSNERKIIQTRVTKSNMPATKISLPVPPKASEPVIRKAESAGPSAEVAKENAAVATPPKVEVATDLFDMLSVHDGSEATPTDDIWAGFQSVGETSATGTKNSSEPADNNKTKSTSEIEDLFKDSAKSPMSQNNNASQKDVKNDILSLFEKGNNTATPYSLHQQQLAMLAQQQSMLMAAAAKSGGLPKLPGNGQQQVAGGAHLPNQNWPNAGYQIPGMMMPAGGKDDEKYLQEMRNIGAANSGANTVQVPASSFYNMGKNVQNPNSFNNMGPPASASGGASRPQSSTTPTSSLSPTQSAKDYDFSSLTQGFFSKP